MNADPDLVSAARHSGLHQGQPYEVRLELRQPGLCLVFQGPVPAAIPAVAMSAIQRAVQAHADLRTYVDLGQCSYLGSGAIACLMEFLRLASPRGAGPVAIINPHPRAMTVLRMLGLSSFFVPQPDDQAVAKWMAEQPRR
jgi:anti-anti-sigma regulatory factor